MILWNSAVDGQFRTFVTYYCRYRWSGKLRVARVKIEILRPGARTVGCTVDLATSYIDQKAGEAESKVGPGGAVGLLSWCKSS